MAVAVKSAAFAMLLRVLLVGFGDERLDELGHRLAARRSRCSPSLTMTVAQPRRGRQESVKRMLAYSSIAHAGYVLVGVVATMRSAPTAQASVLFYLLAYTVSTAGAFGALILCGRRGAEAVSYEDLAGHRPAPPRRGARVLALPAVARRRPADRRLLRQVVRRSAPRSTPSSTRSP